ncbi:DUF159-domain-containing protein [Ascodesmis nigricans]|uniref:DUF159-domain-containing protein n=1 Tax=Ascodesmis nigricans TaxID=341454 RepID=A0A4S2MPS4_9PEZI|nr:DUF159-domain-containing protein [Ascodesmis nigricans]
MCGRWALALCPSQLRERLEQNGLRVDRWIQDPPERINNSEGSANDASSNNTSTTRNTDANADSTMNTDTNAMADAMMDAVEKDVAVDILGDPMMSTMADTNTTVEAVEKDITNKDTATPPVRPSYNVAPTYIEPIYRARLFSSCSPSSQPSATSPTSLSPPDDITYELVPAKWGVIPSWTTTSGEGHGEGSMAIALKTINCRAEKLGEDRGLWAGLRGKGRCVVPAMGWFEWKARGGVKELQTPYFVRPINDDGLFNFAGLYNTININKYTINTFTIITTPSSSQLRFLHTRMPAVLRSPEEVKQWLDPTNTTWGTGLQALLRPYEDEECGFKNAETTGVKMEEEAEKVELDEGEEIQQKAEAPPPPQGEMNKTRAAIRAAPVTPKKRRNTKSPRTTPTKRKMLDGKGDKKITSFFRKLE